MKKNKNQRVHVLETNTATSFITKGKQRLKVRKSESNSSPSTVYLNDGDNFEIELFNSKTHKVLARIKLDGVYIPGGGIILLPGQRVFLERFLDSPNKFEFKTYSVNGISDAVKAAIALNGSVEVEFFDQYINSNWNSYNGSITWQPINNTNPYWYNTSPSHTISPIAGCTYNDGPACTTFTNSTNMNIIGGASSTSYVTTNASISLTSDIHIPNEPVKKVKSDRKKVETGRVEKGVKSNQQFTTDNTTFNVWPASTDKWKILPTSQKQYLSSDIKTYCTECGAKMKKSSYKFCPHCGTKV